MQLTSCEGHNMNSSEILKLNITNVTFHGDIVSNKTLNDIELVFGMILLLPVAILGIIGNIISIIVLRRYKTKSATNYCLMALAISDLLFLLNAVLFVTINIYIKSDPLEGSNFRNILFPHFGIYFSLVPARITSLLTTLLGIERFVAVRFPMRAKLLCNKKVTLMAIILIYCITLVLFLPYPFKYNTVYSVRNNITIIRLARNPNLSDIFCKIYGIIMNFIFRFIPILLIFGLNIAIMICICVTKRKRESLSYPHCKVRDSKWREQRKITIMLLVVSFTFLICILPGAINSLLQTMWKGYSRLGKSRNFQQCVSYVTFFLEAVNSAVNFIIYMALSAKFKSVYRETFYSTKALMRQISFGSVSSKRSSFAFRRKCGSQSSFTNTEEAIHHKLTCRHPRNDSYKSLLEKAGNYEQLYMKYSHKNNLATNGILLETSKNSSESDGYNTEKPSENGLICLKQTGNGQYHDTTTLVKQDTFETSVYDF